VKKKKQINITIQNSAVSVGRAVNSSPTPASSVARNPVAAAAAFVLKMPAAAAAASSVPGALSLVSSTRIGIPVFRIILFSLIYIVAVIEPPFIAA